jgi:hypothetical protein
MDRMHRFGHALFAQRRFDPEPDAQKRDEHKNANSNKTGNFFVETDMRHDRNKENHVRERASTNNPAKELMVFAQEHQHILRRLLEPLAGIFFHATIPLARGPLTGRVDGHEKGDGPNQITACLELFGEQVGQCDGQAHRCTGHNNQAARDPGHPVDRNAQDAENAIAREQKQKSKPQRINSSIDLVSMLSTGRICYSLLISKSVFWVEPPYLVDA